MYSFYFHISLAKWQMCVKFHNVTRDSIYLVINWYVIPCYVSLGYQCIKSVVRLLQTNLSVNCYEMCCDENTQWPFFQWFFQANIYIQNWVTFMISTNIWYIYRTIILVIGMQREIIPLLFKNYFSVKKWYEMETSWKAEKICNFGYVGGK